MRAIIGLVLGTAVALGVSAPGRAQQEPTPVFRGGADVVQLDVSVLDRDHHPVRGLTAADFTVLENGAPREVVAFEPIEIPHRPAPPVPWMREIGPDVATNRPFEGRMVVVVIGGTFGRDFWTASTAGRIADAILEQIGPDDLTAVVYAGDNDHAQSFTSDRSRLRAAMVDIKRVAPDRYNTKGLCPIIEIEPGDPSPPGILYELVRVVDALRADPQRRKTVFLVAPGFRMQPPAELRNNTCLSNLAKDLVRDAQRSNVNIYPIDPGRLLTGWGMGANSRRAPPVPMQARLAGTDGLRVLAESTGGRAVINDKYDRPEAGVPGIFEENASYYILGFRPGGPSTDNRFRRLEVRVSTPGAEVRTRTGYFLNASAPPKGKKAVERSPLEQSLQGLLPSTSVQLRVAAAPLAITAKPRATVAIAISMNLEGVAAQKVEILADAFDLEGESKSSARQTLEVSRGGEIEARLQLPLAPGRYELRVGVQPGDGQPGSVYTSVEVPDFSGERISLSGLVLARDGGSPSVGLLPVVPTATRDFSRSDRVTAFVRVYQGGRPRLAAVTSRIVNDHDEVMLDERTVLDVGRFDSQRTAQHQLVLPLERLPPGEYLLTIEAALEKDRVRRDARFTVK